MQQLHNFGTLRSASEQKSELAHQHPPRATGLSSQRLQYSATSHSCASCLCMGSVPQDGFHIQGGISLRTPCESAGAERLLAAKRLVFRWCDTGGASMGFMKASALSKDFKILMRFKLGPNRWDRDAQNCHSNSFGVESGESNKTRTH